MLRVYTLLLLACIFLPGTISAQLRLTLEGGIAVADFDREPLLPAATRTVFGLADSQTEHFDPLESGYIGLGMAHHPADKPWGWSTRLQFMKRGYRYNTEDDAVGAFPSTVRVYSYSTFIDAMAQVTKTVVGKLRANAGPYLSLALRDYKEPGINLNGPDFSADTSNDYGFNVGISYPFERLSITANYQRSLRRYSFQALNTAFNYANGSNNAVVIEDTPRISALRFGLEYAIWQ